MALERVGKRTGGVRRPEVLVLQVDEATGAAKRFEVRPSNAALALRREWVRRPLRRVGAEHLHGVRSVGRGRVPRRWQRTGMTRLVDQASGREAPRIAMVERRRVFPAFAEGVCEVAERRTPHLELDVVPRRSGAVATVELDWLRIAG